MKKGIAVCLSVALLFSFAACGTETLKNAGKETVSAQTEQNNIAASTENTAWIDMYEDYLDRVLDSEDAAPDAGFGLVYIDGDDTPELTVSVGTYHAAGARLICVYDGKLSASDPIGSFGSFGYAEKTGVVVHGYSGSGVTTVNVSRLVNGELEDLWTGEEADGSMMGMSEEITYSSDGKEVSKEEYDRMYEKYVPIKYDSIGDSVDSGGVHPFLTKENVRLYFDALRHPETIANLRTANKMTLTGTLRFTKDYSGDEYTLLELDTPFVAQVQGSLFPYLVSSVECFAASDDQTLDGSKVTYTGSIGGSLQDRYVSFLVTE